MRVMEDKDNKNMILKAKYFKNIIKYQILKKINIII